MTYRSNRHFDILNENILFGMKGSSSVPQMRNLYESRRSAYGNGLALLNTVSHDEDNYADPWEALLRYGVHRTMDGAPMLFSVQELGLSTLFGFDLLERNFGKFIPYFKTYNSMVPVWNDQLFHVYAGINAARQMSPALCSPDRYFFEPARRWRAQRDLVDCEVRVCGCLPSISGCGFCVHEHRSRFGSSRGRSGGDDL